MNGHAPPPTFGTFSTDQDQSVQVWVSPSIKEEVRRCRPYSSYVSYVSHVSHVQPYPTRESIGLVYSYAREPN